MVRLQCALALFPACACTCTAQQWTAIVLHPECTSARWPRAASAAPLNFGTPEAWLGLQQFLPPGFNSFSAAYAVHQEGSTIYVCGYAVAGAEHAVMWIGTVPPEFCYANCDRSTSPPHLNVDDFVCFINAFAAGQALPYMEQLGHKANCDHSTRPPVLNVDDYTCFINAFSRGCE